MMKWIDAKPSNRRKAQWLQTGLVDTSAVFFQNDSETWVEIMYCGERKLFSANRDSREEEELIVKEQAEAFIRSIIHTMPQEGE